VFVFLVGQEGPVRICISSPEEAGKAAIEGPGPTIKGLWLGLAFFFNYALESN